MKKEDYYKFILAVGVVLLLFGLVNVFAVDFTYRIVLALGVVLVIVAGILWTRKSNRKKL